MATKKEDLFCYRAMTMIQTEKGWSLVDLQIEGNKVVKVEVNQANLLPYTLANATAWLDDIIDEQRKGARAKGVPSI